MRAISDVIDTLKYLLLVRLELEETGLTREKITEDSLLFDSSGIGLDSVEVLDLLVGVEKSFGLKIRSIDAAFLETHCHSIGSLARYIHSSAEALPPQRVS
jgi:acyl carrier protein